MTLTTVPAGTGDPFSFWFEVWLDRKKVGTLEGHTDRVPALAWFPGGKRIVSAGWDTTARVWDATTCQPIILLNSHASQVQTLALSPDGALLACADSSHAIHIWDTATNKQIGNVLRSPFRRSDYLNAEFTADGATVYLVGMLERNPNQGCDAAHSTLS